MRPAQMLFLNNVSAMQNVSVSTDVTLKQLIRINEKFQMVYYYYSAFYLNVKECKGHQTLWIY